MRLARGLAMVLFGAAVLLGGRAAMALPEPTGPRPVGTRLVEISEAGLVQLWYPAAGDGAPAPYRLDEPAGVPWLPRTAARRDASMAPSQGILILVPGWGGRRWDLTGLATDLASHGWLVAALDPWVRAAPPDVAADLRLPFDIGSDAAFARTRAAAEREAPRQAAMVRAVLDALPEAAGLPAVILGASFGGTVAVATARVDQRIRAVVNLDGWVFGDPEAAPFPAPYLLLGSDGPDLTVVEPRDATERRQALMDRREKPGMLRQFEAEGGALVILRGAEHADFFDEAWSVWPRARGRIAPARAQAVLRVAVHGVLKAVLFHGPPPFAPEVLRDYPELKVVESSVK